MAGATAMIAFETPDWFPANVPFVSQNIVTTRLVIFGLYVMTLLLMAASAMFLTGLADKYDTISLVLSVVFLLGGMAYAINIVRSAVLIRSGVGQKIVTMSHAVFLIGNIFYGMSCIIYLHGTGLL